MRKSCRLASGVAALLVSLSPCAGSARPGPLTLRWNYDSAIFSDYLTLEIRNDGSSATCLPAIDVSDYHNVILRQGGTSILPRSFDNRAVLDWRGTDLIGGFIVIPPKHRVQRLYHLTDWFLKPVATMASIVVPAYDCLTFFQSSRPKPTMFRSSYAFEPRRSERLPMSD
jgi:hypothetical protein